MVTINILSETIMVGLMMTQRYLLDVLYYKPGILRQEARIVEYEWEVDVMEYFNEVNS